MNSNSDPVKLFWWREKPNFGDALSQGVVAHVLRRPVEWGDAKSCDLFAVGSILHRLDTVVAREDRPVVWGSGFMKGMDTSDLETRADVVAVRGPLTQSFLGIRKIPLGDPGLFASDLLEAPVPRRWRLGVIPHYSQARYLPKRAEIESKDVAYIDVRTAQFMGVIQAIAACDMIVSSSLHGIIIADSLGIPNRWIDPLKIAENGRMKFYDYALSIGRDLMEPIAPADVAEVAANPDALVLPPVDYGARIDALKDGLRAALLGSRLNV